MSMNDDVVVTKGMQRYIDLNNKYLAKRDKYIRDVVKKWKFDTIAVHGLYTVSVGNLMAGETAVIRYRYAELLDAHDGYLRINVPTVIAPRYGDPGDAREGCVGGSDDAGHPQLAALDLLEQCDGHLLGAGDARRVGPPCSQRVPFRLFEQRMIGLA